jgi:hypothetical protein
MCNPLAFQIIGTAVSVMGSLRQGEAAQEQANAQAQQALNQGAYQADAAKQQAEKIRKAGRAQQGEANAALAASGVKLGQGTALEVRKSIIQNTEEDALSAILSGSRAQSSAQQEAQLLGKAGENASGAGMFGAMTTVLKSGGDYMKGNWKTSAGAGG